MRITEPDWKVFKELRAIALERFSEQILEQCRAIIGNDTLTAHERYRELYQLLHDRDEKMSLMFDDVRRSTAILQVKLIWQSGLLHMDELQEFSSETRRILQIG